NGVEGSGAGRGADRGRIGRRKTRRAHGHHGHSRSEWHGARSPEDHRAGNRSSPTRPVSSAHRVSRAPVLIAGVSVRALAESAARAGARVIALDAYGDLDLRQIARVVPIPRESDGSFDPMRVARASRGIDAGAVTYVSSFENAPAAV